MENYCTGCILKNYPFYGWLNYQLLENSIFKMTNGQITYLGFYYSCVIKIWDNWDKNPLFDWLSQKRPFFRRKKSTETNVKQENHNEDLRNWIIWVIFLLNYSLASKTGGKWDIKAEKIGFSKNNYLSIWKIKQSTITWVAALQQGPCN